MVEVYNPFVGHGCVLEIFASFGEIQLILMATVAIETLVPTEFISMFVEWGD